jgi:osmoprotectant transport system ATP-binding protein
MAQIALEKVSKVYGDEKALQDIDLTFTDDVTTAVVGPSGSGKSTLLQVINGLVRPSGGTVSVFREPIDYGRLPELRLRIGYAVQGTGLFPHLTVEENITLLARLAKWDVEQIKARTEELMRLVNLPLSFAQRYPHELSGGQQREFLHLQQMEARTIVLVTHDLREALKLAQRLVVLDQGSLVQHGTCKEILEDPASGFVRSFFQSQLEQ